MTNIEIMANLAREDQLFVYSPFNGGRMELLTKTVAEIVADAAAMRRPDDPLRALFVGCRVRRTNLADQLAEALETIGLPVASTPIREREVYRHAALDGITVHEINTVAGRAASAEIRALVEELQHGEA